MTGQAFRVVVAEIAIGRLMRVMTCKATDARIIAYEAFAVAKAVRLEADKCRTLPVVAHDQIPGAMTLTAEVRNLVRIHALQRPGIRSEVAQRRIRHVLQRAFMTALAGDARSQLIQREFFAGNRIRRVAVEAVPSLPERQFPSHRLSERVWRYAGVSGRGGEHLVAENR